MKFKNTQGERITLPQLRISVEAGETVTAQNKEQEQAMRRCPHLEPVEQEAAHSKSEAKRQRVQRGKDPMGEDEE